MSKIQGVGTVGFSQGLPCQLVLGCLLAVSIHGLSSERASLAPLPFLINKEALG